MSSGGGSNAGSRPPFQQQTSIRQRYSRAVQLAAQATATFFGLSPTTNSIESQRWGLRRAELLRRRFGNARQPTTGSSSLGEGSLGGDRPDFVRDSTTSRPQSLPVGRAYTVAGTPQVVIPMHSLPPQVVIQSATPRKTQYASDGVTPLSTASTSLARQHPSLELRRKTSVSSMALNSIKQAVRRRPSSKVWGVVQDAEMLRLPSPMDVMPGSFIETPLTPASFAPTAVATPSEAIEITPILESKEEEFAYDMNDAVRAAAPAQRPLHLIPSREAFRQRITPSFEELPGPIMASTEDLAEDLFYDLPRPYFVTRGMLDHCLPSAIPLAVSRFSHLSAIAEGGSSTSSLPTTSDETDLTASVLQFRSTHSIPSVFDDPEMVPKLSSLEGDVPDAFISAVIERPQGPTWPFRIIAQILGRNDRQMSYRPPRKGKGSKKTGTPGGTFDSNVLDFRAFFTYWITIVHIAIFLFSVITYGIAPIGVDTYTTQEMVMREWGVSQSVSRSEPENLWIGPSQASLVHLGARYAPCMRSDSNINKFLESQRESEEESGCCIRNDRSGCIQSTKTYCSDALSTWIRWESSLALKTSALSPRHVTSNYTHGPVCGLDPMYCEEPASMDPFIWPTNITQWPICTKRVPQELIPGEVMHMRCDIIGRPCCVGLVGQCILTTREYCEFQNGYFHQEAFLCSQVSCMGDVCGMIPFADDWKPDQFYRLWTSLFLHAGVLHLLISIAFQMTVMRHLEKYAGWLRISLIYLLSGLVGNLASAIFTPYHAEAGPTGSHFGLIACLVVSLIVDIVHNKSEYNSPCLAVLKIVLICLALFAVGLLPFIDNWAHVFGFVFGAILSCMLLPDVEMKRLTRAWTVCVCLILAAGILAALVLLFYFFPVYECEACAYFNCIPFTPTFCATRRIQLPSLVKA